MNKNLLALALSFAAVTAANAQINNGGLPLSITSNDAAIAGLSLKPVVYQAPTPDKVKEDNDRASQIDPKPYVVGFPVPTNFSFPESGTMLTLANGKKIWRGQLNVAKAPALILYYDQFHLPAGVNFYLTNANGKQILGAYTEQNNSDDGKFATQDVQGETVNLELDMDMEAFANISDIKLHVDEALYLYRGISNLKPFGNNDDNGTSAKPTGDSYAGSSAHCEVNAICPQGSSFAPQRKSVVRILMKSGSACSGTLVNNTSGDCTPYVLTATHCEPKNSKADTTFSQILFYFNFETPDCTGAASTAPTSQTMSGATFVSRANFDKTNPTVIGDFLLMKLKSKVPSSFGAYFAGWSRAETNPMKANYIGFHHPSGDVKKLSTGDSLLGNGGFGPAGIAGSHWVLIYKLGGVEEGSSGSALFDANGRLIGDLSGGKSIQACPQQQPDIFGYTAIMSQYALYSKFSRNWQYPEGMGALDAQLKPWLDPKNVGATTTNALAATATCNASATAISNANSILDDAVSIYPNPVSMGVVRMKVNLAKQSDLNVTFYDITGARKAVYNLGKIANGEFTFDVSAFANGTYLMKINSENATTSKKVMVMN